MKQTTKSSKLIPVFTNRFNKWRCFLWRSSRPGCAALQQICQPQVHEPPRGHTYSLLTPPTRSAARWALWQEVVFFFKKKKKNCRKVISAVSSDGEVHCSPEANLPTQKLTPATTHSLFTHTVSLHISARRTQIHIWKTNVPHWAQAWIFGARTCE